MLRVLCLGYSVTERPGYVEWACARAEADGDAITLLKSGWGGHSLPSIACLIDEILDALPCDGVLLELFTGNVRYFDADTMRGYLDDVLAATARRALPVAFLNLYQGGVDYADERVAGLLAEYRALYAIPYLDLAAPLAAAPDRADFLGDGTHVTPQGAAFLRRARARLPARPGPGPRLRRSVRDHPAPLGVSARRDDGRCGLPLRAAPQRHPPALPRGSRGRVRGAPAGASAPGGRDARHLWPGRRHDARLGSRRGADAEPRRLRRILVLHALGLPHPEALRGRDPARRPGCGPCRRSPCARASRISGRASAGSRTCSAGAP